MHMIDHIQIPKEGFKIWKRKKKDIKIAGKEDEQLRTILFLQKT